jgi:hypothetical protein
VLTLIDAADADYSGTLDAGDVYDVITDVGAASGDSSTDVNGDAIVDSGDVVQTAGAVSSPTPLIPQALVLADSLGMNANGASLSVSDATSVSNVFRRIIKWFRRIVDYIDCQYDCADAFSSADECGEQQAEAFCDCAEEYDLFDPQYALCMQNIRENFLRDCMLGVADAAGICGLCVDQCHPHMNR